MISFWRIFSLELLSLVRSRTLAMLTVASVAWMVAFPCLVKGDGTVEGAREMYIHFSLGGVFALLVVALLASATGSIAKERAQKRLQLTLVRPVRCFSVAFGKICSHVFVGALVIAIASIILLLETDVGVRCNHVLSPLLPSPREEANAMYEEFMKDPETPAPVKKASKAVVLRLLTQRAVDHYQTIPTNSVVRWSFPAVEGDSLAVRMRFTNQMDIRQDIRGVFRAYGREGVVSNITQAVLTVPLDRTMVGRSEKGELEFINLGKSALMLRPRKDVNLLVAGDAFGCNLLRAYVELVSILALIVSVGVFLSAGLGRPVAIFVAFVTLIVSEMSPSVIEQYPDELETKFVDRIGLVITRVAAEMTRPISALSPLDALAKDECVEPREVLQTVAIDLMLAPLVLSLLAALVMPMKQDDMV